MFIVLLRMSPESAELPPDNRPLRESHLDWIKQSLDEGVFLLVGSILPNAGGAILAHNTTYSALQGRIDSDPFVANNIVSAEIVEVSPSMAHSRLQFLLP